MVLSLTALAANAIYAPMATLTIRNLPDDVRDRLRMRAVQNGRSMEAEARALLKLNLDERPALTDAERKRRVRAVQKALQPYRRVGVLASEELIAERRLEAWTETVEAMHETAERGPIDMEAVLRRIERARSRNS